MGVFTGASVEEAIGKGLSSLGLSRSQASITILAKEKKGFLGLFGKQPAQVEVLPLVSQEETVEGPAQPTVSENLVPEAVPAQDMPQPTPVEAHQEEQADLADGHEAQVVEVQDDFEAFVAQEFAPQGHEPAEETADNSEEARQEVVAYVEKIIYEMDLEATITVKGSRRQMILQIETPEPGRIIGYHGKVLKSLQVLAQNFLHDRYSRHFNVTLNVHDYLEHRTETLVEMANKAARRVLETGRTYRLEPMTNSERKVIHKTVSAISGVESYSEGEDPDRYVVIVSRDRY